MKILAVDFSSSLRSVAVGLGDAGSFRVLARAEERHGQSTHAFALMEQVLAEAGLERRDVDCLAIGLGPGSYAGIRVSLAIAQGWQLATGIKTVGVSSVDCLAEGARLAGERGPVSICIDAQRGEFYLADYVLSDGQLTESQPLAIVSRDVVEQRIGAGQTVIGPDLVEMFPQARAAHPDAGVLAELAARRLDFIPAEELEPIYLRAANFVKAPKPAHNY